MATRPAGSPDFKAVCIGIGQALRGLHADVTQEAIPERMAELLRLLDPPLESHPAIFLEISAAKCLK
jgi:hypothetical protein